ncbi:MAG: phenylalanine--tRNA ligase subunit beta [Xenococcaceae cyanobacterium]
MRISLNWLRELVDVTLTPQELAQILTIAGLEVEDIEDRRTLADGVVVGKVIDCQPHPNAKKLRVCQVDIGQDTLLNIVCGASNVQKEIYVPVATVGTYLPAIDQKLHAAKLRGVRSEGMICSLAELSLEKESEGIYIFSAENLQPGDDVRPLLGLDDVILDLTATANRADALSMVGVAREVAALTGASLGLPRAPEISIATGDSSLSLNIADDHACPAYIGTVIEGVKIAPSPDWLKWRLQAAGVRPINNVVDVTNYILLEWGQPLHGFDRERLQALAGGDSLTIGVRFANSNESLKTLDGQNRAVDPQNLLITANDRPVALAGVMGGEETEVHEGTENIVLEAALFDPVVIRRSSRSQSLRTESSARYERGVNQVELDIACKRAIALIIELAGGIPITQAIADARPDHSSQSRSIELRLERIHQVLGSVKRGDTIGQIEAEDVERILTALGCKLEKTEEKTNIWTVTVPSYRYRDLEREIDLIEEVARLYGYDHFCDELPDKTEPGYLSFEYQVRRSVRDAFRAVGLMEVVQYSLVKPEEGEVVVANPLFTEYSALRTNLTSGLIDAFEYNQSQGNGSLNAFEIGRIFWRGEDGLEEADSVAGILGGDRTPQGRWTRGGSSSPMTWYEAKGILESVFGRLGLSVEYQPDSQDNRLHPGRTASLWLQGKRLGRFGQLHPQLRQKRGLPDEVYIFELSFDMLLSALGQDKPIAPRFEPYSTYPAVERDLAFFAPVQVSVAEIERAINSAGSALLDGVELFDQYQGKNVPEGERSLAFSLLYRASDRTLTDEEVEPVHNKVREALVEKFSVTLRS